MNKSLQPKISVVIPVLNGVKTLERAIRSVIEQNYANYELLILDAGSTDGTLGIIERFSANITYWHSKPDGSAYLAINMGAEKATGEIVAQLMADDWFEPGIFKAVATAYIDYPDAEIFSCGGQFVSVDERSNQEKTIARYTSDQALILSFRNICFGIPAMSSRFLKKTLLARINLFDPINSQGKHIFSADREFLLRAIAAGAKNKIIPQLGHTYFAHAGSATFGKHRATQLRILGEHMDIADKYLAKPGLQADQYAILKYWYIDQSVRLLIFKLLELDFVSAGRVAFDGIKRFKLAWSSGLIYTPCRIIFKKLRYSFGNGV
jgi:glycosyltransferase involved in cell wall biosynthesis